MCAQHARADTAAGAAESTQWDLVKTRVFDAPRELVFRVWTEAAHVAAWWGPAGFTNPVCEVDARVGGAIRIHMRAPDGKVYPMTAVIEEIAPPEGLVFVSSALDEQGNSMFDVRNEVLFAEEGGKTKLTLRARVVKSTAVAPQYLKGMDMGWTQSLERLGAYVAKESAKGSTEKGS